MMTMMNLVICDHTPAFEMARQYSIDRDAMRCIAGSMHDGRMCGKSTIFYPHLRGLPP